MSVEHHYKFPRGLLRKCWFGNDLVIRDWISCKTEKEFHLTACNTITQPVTLHTEYLRLEHFIIQTIHVSILHKEKWLNCSNTRDDIWIISECPLYSLQSQMWWWIDTGDWEEWCIWSLQDWAGLVTVQLYWGLVTGGTSYAPPAKQTFAEWVLSLLTISISKENHCKLLPHF